MAKSADFMGFLKEFRKCEIYLILVLTQEGSNDII